MALQSATTAQQLVTAKSSEFLNQMQAHWTAIGVTLEDRKKVRSEIESCVDDKCKEVLGDVERMEAETREEIARLESESAMMEGALNLNPNPNLKKSKLAKIAKTMLEKLTLEQARSSSVLPRYNKAKEKKRKIVEDVKTLMER